MKGFITSIHTGFDDHGSIHGDDGHEYSFDSRDLANGTIMHSLHNNDEVIFVPSTTGSKISKLKATSVELSKSSNQHSGLGAVLEVRVEESSDYRKQEESSEKQTEDFPIKFNRCGYSTNISDNKQQYFERHLKRDSGEKEILEKLSKVLYISYINHHDLGYNKLYPFCLIGATEVLKQYIRGQYEFLLVFSHFDTEDWQQSTINAAKFIRRRREIADRRPLVNFFILVSNARNLKQEIDRMKGGTDAVIIPFTFEEMMNCSDRESLISLLLSRFDEYYFENNMLDETGAIEEDALLFGDRGKIADSIVQRCKEKKLSGIFGLRRSGKSSVLSAVMRRLDIANIPYIKVEARNFLQGNWKTALFDIASMIRDKLQVEENKTEAEYEKRPVTCFIEDVKKYTQGYDVFVIAIDEVERITYNSTTSEEWKKLNTYELFWTALRDCGCPLIICGVNSTINERDSIKFKGQSCDNPMYGRIINCSDSEKTYLPPFSDEQTKFMLNTLGDYSNVGFDNVYSEINNSFGGQPFAIRQFSAFMFNQLKDKREKNNKYQFSKPAFEKLNADFCSSQKGKDLFNQILQHIETYYKEEYETLKKIAFNPQKNCVISKEKDRSIDHLVKYGLIDYDRTSDYISFRIHALQKYIIETEEKRPEDMDNEERRKYVQGKIVICERKLKSHIHKYYYSDETKGKNILKNYVQPKKGLQPAPDPNTSNFDDLFDHKKFIMFFSDLRKIISNNWCSIGKRFNDNGMSQSQFNTYMIDMNAGRTDADHYDPEDMTSPDEWDITDNILTKFMVASRELESIFKKLNI